MPRFYCCIHLCLQTYVAALASLFLEFLLSYHQRVFHDDVFHWAVLICQLVWLHNHKLVNDQ